MLLAAGPPPLPWREWGWASWNWGSSIPPSTGSTNQSFPSLNMCIDSIGYFIHRVEGWAILHHFPVNNTPCLLFSFLSARQCAPLNGFSVVFDPGLKFSLVENCSSQPLHVKRPLSVFVIFIYFQFYPELFTLFRSWYGVNLCAWFHVTKSHKFKIYQWKKRSFLCDVRVIFELFCEKSEIKKSHSLSLQVNVTSQLN